jgi:YgiT-type zinc finger domain-containing protein
MANYDDCIYCGGSVREQTIKKTNFWGEELTAIIDNVPAGVCGQCGEKYYKVKVLKTIEKLLRERSAIVSRVQIPVADFALAE